MQNGLLRAPGEDIKVFTYNYDNEPIEFKIWKFDEGVTEELTIPININDLGNMYYSMELTTPFESCYLLILFCGQSIVLRVGEPKVEFVYYYYESEDIDYIHYNEFGQNVSEGKLIEVTNGFYYYEPVETTLGYIEIFETPDVLNVPYFNGKIEVCANVFILWDKVVIHRQFGVKEQSQHFKVTSSKLQFKQKSTALKFKSGTETKKFNLNIIKQTFKKQTC